MRIVGLKKSILKMVAIAALSTAAVSCGDDEGDDDSDLKCDVPNEAASAGFVTKFPGDAATVAFPDAAVGNEYLVMPYALGKLTDVRGDDGSTNFNFTVSAAKGKVLGIVPLESEKFALSGFTSTSSNVAMSPYALQHAKRSIINRFNSRKVGGQGEDFWQLVRRVDAADRVAEGVNSSTESLESILRKQERSAFTESRKVKKFKLLAGECPSGELSIPLLSGNGTGVQGLDIESATIVDGGEFCIVLVDQPTATTADEIKTIATSLIKTYKTTVYANDFGPKNGMTFKPVIAVIDFNNAEKWPAALKTLYGVFADEPSEAEALPILYMPTTITGITDATVIKKTWYATLAHEMQHANINYFRKYAANTKVEEIPALDEGLAHYFEDFFGFGSIGFKDFAGTHLGQWYNEFPFIVDGEAGDTNAGRGAAQNLWYYLASQKGGITYTDGAATGGGGVEFIRKAVTDSSVNGPNGLAKAFTGDWTETVGNFFGALAVDGSSTCALASRYKTQGPVDTVKDLTGTVASYGYRFNGNASITSKDRVWDADRQLTELPKVIEDVPYYAPAPFIYKVVDVTAELKVTRSAGAAAENMAVSVVKIK